jgi:hypothetical protein
MRPYYMALVQRDAQFALFAPSTRFALLIDAISADHPSKGAEMRGWTVPTQTAFLAWLHDVTTERTPRRAVDLWTVHKEARALRCSALYLPMGLDVRLMEGSEIVRT